MYDILPYSYHKAKLLNVKIFPSNNPKYKIDIYKPNLEYITSIGAPAYKDFPTYSKEQGIEYANNRRRLYKIRHERNIHKVGTRSFYADQILW